MTHSERAVGLFMEGYNCSQALLGAYCDELRLDFETALRLASSFGGGVGRMRGLCGAVSGMCMAAGLARGYSDPADREAKTAHYAYIQQLAGEFKQHNGSLDCGELLGEMATKGAAPQPRDEKFYRERPCARLIADAADILERSLSQGEAVQQDKKTAEGGEAAEDAGR